MGSVVEMSERARKKKSLTSILSQTHSYALTAGPSRTGVCARVSPSGREKGEEGRLGRF
jgi:hypothetical protein